MTYVCYYECDGCRKRVPGDLTPEGWYLGVCNSDADYCAECRRAREPTTSASPGEKK